jgi:TolB-like protein
MLKNISIVSLLSLFLLTGCSFSAKNIDAPQQNLSQQAQMKTKSLDDTIVRLSDKLKDNSTLDLEKISGTVTVTSFVDLNNLDKTTQFGRLLGESMLSELFSRGFNVSDFRGQGVITIDKDGEFYITRDARKLEAEVPNTYILVGTYTKIGGSTLLNARIIDNTTGKLVASARDIYDEEYCDVAEDACYPETKKKIKIISVDSFALN